jgi:hypothetical protein
MKQHDDGSSAEDTGIQLAKIHLPRKARFLQIVARLMARKRPQNGLRLRIGVARLSALGR